MKKEKRAVKKKKQNDFFFVCKHIKFSWGLIILSMIVGVVQSVVASMVPDATANLFDGDFSPSKLWGVIQTLLITLTLGLASYIVRVFAESKSVLAARTSVWDKMVHAGMEYYDTNDPASRLSMITVDAQTLGQGLVQLFVFIPTIIALMLANMVQLLGYDPKLLLVLVVLIPMHIIYFVSLGRYQQNAGKEYAGEVGDLTGYLAERIRNLPMIKSFAAESVEDQNGVEAAGRLYKVMKKFNVYIQCANVAYQSLAPVASNVLAVLWGCHLLRTGQTDVTTFLAFSMYIVTINSTFLVISTVWVFVKDFAGRANRLARLLEAPMEQKTSKKSGTTQIPSGDIQVEQVSFRYPSASKAALENVSFTIPEGKLTAIVGPSGSGKTTLIRLLERLYHTEDGKISVGGTDIQTLDLESWRKNIAYVVQDAGVFSGTVREAFCYGTDRKVSDEELMQAAKTVGLDEYISSLPDGFETQLANWGSSLSGGQRQRIAIVRALLRQSNVLIFDEPTSALDPEAAAAISKIIFEGFRDKTVIIISHELNFVTQADHIVVVDQGILAGEGNHAELMNTCKVYAELVQEQSYREVFSV